MYVQGRVGASPEERQNIPGRGEDVREMRRSACAGKHPGAQLQADRFCVSVSSPQVSGHMPWDPVSCPQACLQPPPVRLSMAQRHGPPPVLPVAQSDTQLFKPQVILEPFPLPHPHLIHHQFPSILPPTSHRRHLSICSPNTWPTLSPWLLDQRHGLLTGLPTSPLRPL